VEFRKWKVEGIEFQTGQALVVRVHTLVPSILDPSLVRCLYLRRASDFAPPRFETPIFPGDL